VLNRRQFLKLSAAAGASVLVPWREVVLGSPVPIAYGQLGQAAQLPGSAIPQFVDPLPDLHITGATSITLQMTEFQSPVMPSTFVPAAGAYTGTWVWGYLEAGQTTIPSYIGPVILATRGTPTQVTYMNTLGDTNTSQLTAWVSSTDQTLHWADPANLGHVMANYAGPIPAVPHLHGGEVPPVLDGGPDAWFLSDAYNAGAYPTYTPQGHAYYGGGATAVNTAIYRYPNSQEAANIWFHDHVLGATRLNVYAGLAGAYLISDPGLALPAGLGPHDLGGETIVPLVIQDRSFDVNGQFFMPNAGINPEHPFWVPEFVGDTMVVNGKVWPTFGTALAPKASKRYRFLFLNGSNARAYEFFFVDPVTKVMGPPIWVIGTDGGYLDAPVKIDPNSPVKTDPKKLVLMPGERYDVIVDFNDPAWRALNPNFSGTLILKNTGNTPYPKGSPPPGSTLGQVMKFFIGAPVADGSYDPASGTPLRPPMVRLVNPAAGTAAVTPALTRQLTLNEFMGPGGPLEVLVNNTKWGGHSVATDAFTDGIRPDFTLDPSGTSDTYYSELPVEGQAELWEIINLTADAHPIHLHLVQFQLMNRQNFNVNKYNKAYNALFPATPNLNDPLAGMPYPGGVFIGGFGPPADYATGTAWSAKDTFGGAQVTTFKGGNPDVTPYLQGPVKPPETYERGWKDTVIMYPGQVTRIIVRWAPTDLGTGTPAAQLYYPFDPNGGHGYVWHCHIIDHEDNEMMRPDSVQLNPAAPTPANRPLKQGPDY
jgi:spore coat protein A